MTDKDDVVRLEREKPGSQVSEDKTDQAQTNLAKKIYTLVDNSDLPKGDYVECSVAIEQALSDLGLEDIPEEEEDAKDKIEEYYAYRDYFEQQLSLQDLRREFPYRKDMLAARLPIFFIHLQTGEAILPGSTG